MAEEEDESPPDEGGGGSIPKWVVTFSDLMSLLLAFFVLLFAFSSQDDKKFKQMGGSLQEAFGVQRMDMFSDAVLGMNHIAQEFSSSRPDNTIVNIIPQEQFMMAIRYLTKEPPVRRNTLDSRGESEDDADKKKSEETVDPEAVEAAKAVTTEVVDNEDKLPPTSPESEVEPESESATATKAQSEQTQEELAEESVSQQQQIAQTQSEQATGGGAKSEENSAGGQQAANQAEDGRKAAKYDAAANRSISETEPNQENEFQHKGELAEKSFEKLHSGARELRQKLAKEIEQGLIDVETNGDKLIIRIADETSFGPGSAELSEPAGPIMSPIADVLEKVQGEIIVQGHTDDLPLSNSKFASNWDLSAGRAATVVREIMKVRPIAKERFHVEAYAETRPLVTNKTDWGRARNRRVEIIVHQEPSEELKKRIRDPLDPEPLADPNEEKGKNDSAESQSGGHDELDSLFADFPNMFDDEGDGGNFIFNAGE